MLHGGCLIRHPRRRSRAPRKCLAATRKLPPTPRPRGPPAGPAGDRCLESRRGADVNAEARAARVDAPLGANRRHPMNTDEQVKSLNLLTIQRIGTEMKRSGKP